MKHFHITVFEFYQLFKPNKMKTTLSILLLATACILGHTTANASQPITKSDIAAMGQIAEQYLKEKAADKEKLIQETELLRSKEDVDYETISKMIEEKVSSFKKKWNTELIRRFEAKKMDEPLRLTRLLTEYAESREAAFSKWRSDVLALDSTAYGPAFRGYLEDFPLEREWEGKFITLVNENPTIIYYPEDLIEDICNISASTSDDYNLRYYSWWTGRGGTMTCICEFCQFRTFDGQIVVPMAEKVNSWEHAEPEMVVGEETSDCSLLGEMPWEWKQFIEKIHTIDTGIWKIYLVVSRFNASSLFRYTTITAQCIADDNILDFPIFYDNGKTFESITTLYDMDDSFEYDEKNKTLTVNVYDEENVYDGYQLQGIDTYTMDGFVLKKK